MFSVDKHSAKARKISIFLIAAYALLGANLAYMQIIKADYYRSLSEKNRVRVIYLEAPRGKILDRANRALATSRLSFNLSVVPREAKTHLSMSCRVIGEILGEDPAALEKRFQKRKAGSFNSVILAEDISAANAMAIEERLDLLPGFLIETRPQRVYPYGPSTAHLTGYLGPMTEEEIEGLEEYGYRRADWLGRDGIEKAYEGDLRGQSGGLQIEVNNRGRLVKPLGVKEPIEGNDVTLTVDARLQEYAQGLLGGQKGSVIVMELKRGGILSINSAPSFDANFFSSTPGRREVGPYLKDPNAPMMNRGIRGHYPPGSIFKIVTALAALERHRLDPGTSINCPGFSLIGGIRFRCWKEGGHGPQMLLEAFAHSCNVYFHNAGLRAGFDALRDKALQFGFDENTGIDLPGEKKGFVPSRDWKRKTLKQGWYDGDTANMSIGQGYLQVSPIQSLVMVAAIATGEMFYPHMIDKIRGVSVTERHARPMNLDARSLAAVRRGLHEVINSDTGTGRLAKAPGLTIAGKTGTAQSGQDRTHAWFVGYAPEENPRVAMVVFLENGGRGGVNAATLASKVFSWLHEAGYA
jgi:penicillin-binding protein 2